MIYRVQAALYIVHQDDAEEAYSKLQEAIERAITINPETPDSDHSWIQWHACHHDDMPIGPCSLIDRQETA